MKGTIMKNRLSIKLLLLTGAIVSSQRANAYCFYLEGTHAFPVEIEIYKTEKDYKTTETAKKVIKIVGELGATGATAYGSPEIGSKIPIGTTWVTDIMKQIIRKAHHNLMTAVKNYGCWNWESITKDVFKGNANRETLMYFVAVDISRNILLGAYHFPIGGYVKIKVNPDGKGAFQVFHPMVGGVERSYYKTPNY